MSESVLGVSICFQVGPRQTKVFAIANEFFRVMQPFDEGTRVVDVGAFLVRGAALLVEKSVFGDAEMLDQRLTELARVAPRPDGYIDRLFLSS